MNNVTQPPGAIRAAFCRGVSGKGARTRRLKSCDCYSFDGNGNVAALASAANGNVTAQYGYGPFGEVIRQTGPIAKANPMRFSTKYQDDESDLVYYGHRYYKASTGTWLSADPIDEMGFQITNARRGDRPQGESNLYLYVKNNSILYIDVNGLNWADVQKMYDAFLATFDALCKSCKRCDSPHFGNLCSLFGASTLGCSKQADALGANILAVKKRRSLGYTKSLLVLFGWAFNS